MASRPEPVPASFEIVAEVRYADALLAALSQFRRRAPVALVIYGLALAASLAGSWVTGGAFFWLAGVAGALGCATVALVAWTTHRDFQRSGGRPLRMRYHVCSSGVEIRAAGRGDWVAWEDLWDAGETSRSFLLSPAPGEHYVIPKRCCDSAAASRLREALRGGASLAIRGWPGSGSV